MVVPQAAAQLLKPVIVPPAGTVWIAAVQVNVVPATVELNATLDAVALQIVCGEAEPTGVGLTVTVARKFVPGQLNMTGVIVKVTVTGAAVVFVRVPLIGVPAPLEAMPITDPVLSLVQV